MHNVQFNVPGLWKLKAVIIYDGYPYFSNEVEMEVWFPSVYEMKNDIDLQYEMENLWQQTLNLAGPGSRQEMGAWIYAYISSGNELKFHVEEDPPGPITMGCAGSAANILPSIPSTEFPETPYDTDVKFYVGYFHTHTTLHYRNTGERPTGISPGDKSYAEGNNIPVLLYDYTANPLQAGHSLNDPYELSWVETVEIRETPTFWIGQ